MSTIMQINPYGFFADANGVGLNEGYVWIGQSNKDPRQYPVSAFYDAAMTIPAPMPLRTQAGYIVRNNAPTFLYINGNYSVLVEDKTHVQQFYVPDFLLIGSSSAVSLADLSNYSNPMLGAGLVGRATRQINNLAELRTVVGRYDLDMAYLERYTAGFDYGFGNWIWSASSVTADNGVTVVQVTGVTTGRWLRAYESLTAGMFGGRPVAGFDNATAFAAIETFLRGELAAFRRLPAIGFEAGTWECSLAPNWGIQGATFLNLGKVKLRGTGAGSVVILDAGIGIGINITGLTFGQGSGFIIENGPSATAPTALIRAVYLSDIRCRCWGAGTTQSGFNLLGNVLSKFWIATTPTESAKETPADYTNGWYLGGKPSTGKSVSESIAGAQNSYCTFYNWLGAACQYGMYIDSTLGNIWIGGDNEFNTTTGAFFTVNAIGNKVIGQNYEVNTVSDVECAGRYNEFICDSVNFLFSGGFGNRLLGGQHNQLSITGGIGNFMGDVVYGRGLAGNLVIVDNGTNSGFGWCYQAQSQTWSQGPSKVVAITVGASPFTYTNTTNRVQLVGIAGGTVSNASYFRGAQLIGAAAGGGVWPVSPGDKMIVTYSVAPTMTSATA